MNLRRIRITALPAYLGGEGQLPDITREFGAMIFGRIAAVGLPWTSKPMTPGQATAVVEEFSIMGAVVESIPAEDDKRCGLCAGCALPCPMCTGADTGY